MGCALCQQSLATKRGIARRYSAVASNIDVERSLLCRLQQDPR
jgi:hypothetical protein